MELPCIDCAYRTEREEGHRIFVGCKDEKRKKENFVEDTWLYRHSCKAYEKEKLEKDGEE
jgi:hypothetical protein